MQYAASVGKTAKKDFDRISCARKSSLHEPVCARTQRSLRGAAVSADPAAAVNRFAGFVWVEVRALQLSHSCITKYIIDKHTRRTPFVTGSRYVNQTRRISTLVRSRTLQRSNEFPIRKSFRRPVNTNPKPPGSDTVFVTRLPIRRLIYLNAYIYIYTN